MYFLTCTNPSVRIVTDKVTVDGVEFTFMDRSVGGLDDKVYESDRTVWESVPRGDCLIAVGKTVVAHVVGLRKFGYPGAPYGRRSDVSNVVLIDKMNGECAHIAAFVHAGTRYWVAGSKHVHIAWRAGHYDSDSAAYVAQRYKYALKVAAVWNRMLTMEGVDAEWFFTMLDGMKATACAEAILSDSEHIVSYSEYMKDTLQFYAIAEPSDASVTLCASPAMASALFTRCGLPTATYSPTIAAGSVAYAAALDAVARRTNSEGVVAYGLDNDGHVVCMWKEKSYPYVMERVVREAILGDRSIPQIKRRVLTRLADQDADVRAYFTEWESTRFPYLLTFAA